MIGSVASMVLNSEEANRMQSAVDTVFACLPKALKTEEIKIEIARSVVISGGDYRKAARDSALVIFRRQRALTNVAGAKSINRSIKKGLGRPSRSEQLDD